MGFIETHKKQIQRLCENHKVRTLYAFGSVNSKKFSKKSDVDLVVDFKIEDPIEYTDNYFDLKFELEKIFDRQVDLLESKAIKNPYLKESIDRTKVLVYG
jgi:predicted nucleotidyltransferase